MGMAESVVPRPCRPSAQAGSIQEQDKVNAPILSLLKVNEDLITDNQAQLDRLLDLYLSGTFDKDVLTDRKTRLETIIAKLERELGELKKRLGHRPSNEEIEDVMTFAYDLAAGLAKADRDFAKRRKIVEMLDVRGIQAIEDGEKVVHASFVLTGNKPERLRLADYVHHLWYTCPTTTTEAVL